jgi:putative transposase
MKNRDRLGTIGESRIYRRNLPHVEEPGSVYLITFTTDGESVLSNKAKDIVLDSIKFHAGKKYRLYACVVMETHVHFIIQPLKEQNGGFFSIAQIMHSIKSYSAHEINKKDKTDGNIWLHENYDRIIRGDADFLEKMNYIIGNPLKAGVAKSPEAYRWLFIDDSD